MDADDAIGWDDLATAAERATETVEQLKQIWAPESQGTITRWNQIDPSWPDAEFKLYGAGSDSGTFDYFTARAMTELGNDAGAATAFALLVHILLWLPPTLIGGIYLLLNPTRTSQEAKAS